MARETWVQSQVESYQRLKKWYLMPPCLTLSIIKVRIKGKVEQSREGVAPSPTPWCSSYRKGSLRVTLDYGRQLYLLTLHWSQLLKNYFLLNIFVNFCTTWVKIQVNFDSYIILFRFYVNDNVKICPFLHRKLPYLTAYKMYGCIRRTPISAGQIKKKRKKKKKKRKKTKNKQRNKNKQTTPPKYSY